MFLLKEVLYMPYFTIEKTFLFPSFDISFEERQKLNAFLEILENSGIGPMIEECTKKGCCAGRKPYNPHRLLASIIYGFAKHSGSVRKIEESMNFDLRFIYLMEQGRPSYATISTFLNNVVVPNQQRIFSKIIASVIRRFGVNIDDVFLDGTKFEANANKFKFVWRPTALHGKLNLKVRGLLGGYVRLPDSKSSFTSKEIGEHLNSLIEAAKAKGVDLAARRGRGRPAPPMARDIDKLKGYLGKALDYEEKEEICGERNSYYKTDKDATAMCLKEDYYSGLGSNMHAGYNVQLMVSKGIIVAYYVGQERNDFYEFIPAIEAFRENYGFYPKRLCADAGYGSLSNYRYLKEHGIGNFVKYGMWRQDVSGRSFDCYRFDGNHQLVCLNGKTAREESCYNGRHPRAKSNKYYIVDNCRRCKYKALCFAPVKNKKASVRVFEANEELYLYKKEARENLLSVKGIEMRVNRSSQVEGAFGVIKQDMDYERIRRRGLEKVSAEIMLVSLGYVFRKVFGLLSGKGSIDYWSAPETLAPEKIPELNMSKILLKKKRAKGRNEALRKSYKRPKRKKRGIS